MSTIPDGSQVGEGRDLAPWYATTPPLAPDRRALALRGAVIARKLSLGSQSAGGEQRIERLLSAHTNCLLQRRSLHAYLVDLLTAHPRGDPAPLLS